MNARAALSWTNLIWLWTIGDSLGSTTDYLASVKPLLAEHCYECHGADQQKGGLRLDTGELVRTGGEHGPSVIPGDSEASLLVRVVEGIHSTLPRMPRGRASLSPTEIELIRRWIDQGASSPSDEDPEKPGSRRSKHWAFQKPDKPDLPDVTNGDWPRNEIDRFILARLEDKGIEPSPEADRVTLLRRLSLDLTGLPPSPEEITAFLKDDRPSAYDAQVDRLLGSPHYGERWGRHWLDGARYADSNGYSIDGPRSMWPYRDWVVDAFNRDMPFDQFTIEQLAGDLLPRPSLSQIIATGFHRNTQINQEGGIDKEQFRIESVFDRVATTSTVFLGLTLACAQCHDHKFDPLSQKDFYRFFAYFNSDDEPTLEIAPPADLAARNRLREQLEQAQGAARRQRETIEMALSASDGGRDFVTTWELKRQTAELLRIPPELRTEDQQKRLLQEILKSDPEYQARQTQIAQLEEEMPRFPSTLVLRARKAPRPTHLFIKGDFTRPAEEVAPGVPEVLHDLPEDSGTTRLSLARWIVDPDNPLTARVVVNRVWQRYFGRGIVETENDFGTQGIPPSHPALLDYLATEWMRQGWKMKALHRLIVTSATYRQASAYRPELKEIDPNNRLLARQNRLRLEAEVVRDVALSASGLMTPRIGGPSVHPPQPDGVMSLGQVQRRWEADRGADRFRRGLYTFFWRATPHPALSVFDAPDAFSTCTRRIRSNTPLQALTLLNDRAWFEFAHALAMRVLSGSSSSTAARIHEAFRLCLGRLPSSEEAGILTRLLQDERDRFANAPDEAQAMLETQLHFGRRVPLTAEEKAAWISVARVLLNLDETITRE